VPEDVRSQLDLGGLPGRLRSLPRQIGLKLGIGSGGSRGGGGLGTFVGVYTPTLLTILGVILYLRFGWVVGHAGILRTLGIVIIANAITFVTTLALSAVATNSRVGVGGAYYMISRSLGLEIGGAVGLPLFLSQAFSVTLYAFGLAESLRFAWPDLPVQLVSLCIVLAVGALAFRGADTALRSQVPIMGLIALSLVALALGALREARLERLVESVAVPEPGFWDVFAVFFPAVTGIMAGLSLSGDLEAPKRAIPRGAIAAQLTGFVLYLVVPVALALAVEPEALREDPLVWTRIAPGGIWLILPGLWGAIFSSAVGSMLGAPRTLQALALDRIAPRWLARADGGRREPVLGLWVSLTLALAAVWLGDLNAVAALVTMFFLMVYGILNLAAALEGLSGDPSWRPEIRAPWGLYLIGALACFGTMLLIDVLSSLLAMAVVLALWILLQRRERRASWGDVRRGVYEALIRWALIRLTRRPMSARSWRPHLLVFVEPVERKLELVRFATWLSEGRGVVTVCELVVGDLLQLGFDPLDRQNEIQTRLDESGIAGFAEVDVVPNIAHGIVSVAQANGMAGIESNMVLLGWPGDVERLATMLGVVERLERAHKSLVIGRCIDDFPARGVREIHVWWGGLQRNGDLMLLLAYLLSRNPEWRDARIRIRSIASNDLMKAETERTLALLMPELRIEAEVEVFVKPPDAKVNQVIRSESATADVVLMGLAQPRTGEEHSYASKLVALADGLRSFFFVKNNSLFIGDLISTDAEVSPSRLRGQTRRPEREVEDDGRAAQA